MAFDPHTNFAYSLIATAPSPAGSGTTLSVDAGTGALFPAAPFNCTVWPVISQPLSTNAEVIRVTSKGTGDNWTIVRTQEGSSARNIVVGDQIAATITAKILTDVESGPASGDLGGNYPSPTVKQASQNFRLTGVISPSIDTDQNNWNPTGLAAASVILVSNTAFGSDVNITGLAGGVDGRIVVISYLAGAGGWFILKHQSSSSLAANRFDFGDSTYDITLVHTRDSVVLRYDGTLSRWCPVSRRLSFGNVSGVFAGSSSAGLVETMSRQDHKHDGRHSVLSTMHSDSLAGSVHDGDVIIGNITPAWSRLAITVPGANVLNVLGVVATETRPSWKSIHDATAPTTIAVGDSATAGTALTASHRDHKHGSPSTWTPATHDMVSTHSYTGGAALDVFGLSAANTIARLTPSANPGAAAAILATDASGLLTLAKLTVSTDIQISGSITHYIHSLSAQDLTFRMWNGSGNVDALTIKKTGEVGIGTINPYGTLHMNSGGANIDPSLTTHAISAWILESAGVELAAGVASASPYAYWMQARSGGGAWAIAINPGGGNVGVGKIPTQALDVSGQIRTDVTLTTGAKTQARYFPMNINGTVVNVLTD